MLDFYKKDKQNNDYFHYLSEKTQKITEALYRVTDIFPDKEPLKWFLRKEGLNIFQIFMKLKSPVSLHQRAKYIEKIDVFIPAMISNLELASLGTFISRKNFEVLSREYSKLSDYIKDKRNELLPEYFDFNELKMPLLDNSNNNSNSKERDFTGTEAAGVEDNQYTGDDLSGYYPTKIHSKNSQLASKNRPNLGQDDKDHSAGTSKKNVYEYAHANPRHDKIIAVLKEKGWMSVSDLSTFFAGLSEKTIQRDLVYMADKGIVQKYGDKRWRKYSLNLV